METEKEQEEEYNNSERIIVFVDGNNLYHCLKEKEWNTWIDIGLLAKRLAGNRMLEHIYFYNVHPPGNEPNTEKTNAYYACVKNTPNLTFRYSWLQAIQKADEYGLYKSYKEKGGDTAITADIVSLAAKDEYDTAIIVASDGDYLPAAKILEEYHKSVEVVYFQGRKPFVMESYALMRVFRPGYAVPYDSKPPPQIAHEKKHAKYPKRSHNRRRQKDYRQDKYQEDES
jgi:uncharacterized LabA/DUF88 family protein